MNWITDTASLQDLARQTDVALTQVEGVAKRGYVADGLIANPKRSYFYTDDDGVLKFYNVVTGITKTVTLS